MGLEHGVAAVDDQGPARSGRGETVELHRGGLAIDGNQAKLQPDHVFKEGGHEVGALDRVGSEIGIVAGYLETDDLTATGHCVTGGVIPKSGYRLREPYGRFDAERRFADVAAIESRESELCISGLVLQGVKKPHECPAFGAQCTPRTPLGATMVSSEGACAAYYKYGRVNKG